MYLNFRGDWPVPDRWGQPPVRTPATQFLNHLAFPRDHHRITVRTYRGFQARSVVIDRIPHASPPPHPFFVISIRPHLLTKTHSCNIYSVVESTIILGE